MAPPSYVLTDDMRANIRQMRESGISWTAIAGLIGVSKWTIDIISREFRSVGVGRIHASPTGPRLPWTQERDTEMVRRFALGENNARIAQALETSKAAVTARMAILRERGLSVTRGECRGWGGAASVELPPMPSRSWATPPAIRAKPVTTMRRCLGTECGGASFPSVGPGNRLCSRCLGATSRVGIM